MTCRVEREFHAVRGRCPRFLRIPLGTPHLPGAREDFTDLSNGGQPDRGFAAWILGDPDGPRLDVSSVEQEEPGRAREEHDGTGRAGEQERRCCCDRERTGAMYNSRPRGRGRVLILDSVLLSSICRLSAISR